MDKKREAGFSLAEMMIAAGLMGVIFVIGIRFFNMQQSDLDKATDRLESAFDNLITEKIIARDIKNSKFSFNLIAVGDDSGKKLFDFYPDVVCESDCTRKLSLKAPSSEGQFSKSLYLIVVDYNNPRELRFRPIDAYNASGDFVSLNNGGGDGILRTKYPEVWRKDNLILLYSSTYARKAGVNPSAVPPKLLSFLGWIPNQSGPSKLIKDSLSDSEGASNFIELYNPLKNLKIKSENDLFMGMGHTAGLANYTYIVPVKIIRYRLGATKSGRKGKIGGTLFRGVRKPNMKFQERAIGHGINEVIISRRDVASPILDLSFN